MSCLCSDCDESGRLVTSVTDTGSVCPTTVAVVAIGLVETCVSASIALTTSPCTKAAHYFANFTATTRSSCSKKAAATGLWLLDFAH